MTAELALYAHGDTLGIVPHISAAYVFQSLILSILRGL